MVEQASKAKHVITPDVRQQLWEWKEEVEGARCLGDLTSSESSWGETVPDFELLDSKIASGLRKILWGTSNIKTKLKKENRKRKGDSNSSFLIVCSVFLTSNHWQITSPKIARKYGYNEQLFIQVCRLKMNRLLPTFCDQFSFRHSIITEQEGK